MDDTMNWQPIETAPKDGTEIDLWMVDESGRGFRVTDARWAVGCWDEFYEEAASGGSRRVGKERDGWMAEGYGYPGERGFCDVPRHFNDNPAVNKWIFTEATHWMPPPDPPSA
jgi:hypothetical protein